MQTAYLGLSSTDASIRFWDRHDYVSSWPAASAHEEKQSSGEW